MFSGRNGSSDFFGSYGLFDCICGKLLICFNMIMVNHLHAAYILYMQMIYHFIFILLDNQASYFDTALHFHLHLLLSYHEKIFL